MKKILIIAMLLMLIVPALALPDVYDQLRGRQMVGDGGAPWFKDNAVMYFGTDKDTSLKFNSTSGYLEMVGLTAYDNTSITMPSGEDITFAGGDSKMDLSAGSGIFKTPLGAVTIGPGAIDVSGTQTIASGEDIIAAGGASDFDFSLSSGFFKTPQGTFTVTNGGTVPTAKTWAITDADKLTVGGVIVPQEMVLTIPIGASEVDQTAFIADDAWQITKIEEAHSVAQNTAYPNTGNLSINKCTGTQAPNAGAHLHNTTMWLNSTINTVVTPTLNAATGAVNLADGNRICLDFNGTMTTFAGGSVTIHMKRI